MSSISKKICSICVIGSVLSINGYSTGNPPGPIPKEAGKSSSQHPNLPKPNPSGERVPELQSKVGTSVTMSTDGKVTTRTTTTATGTTRVVQEENGKVQSVQVNNPNTGASVTATLIPGTGSPTYSLSSTDADGNTRSGTLVMNGDRSFNYTSSSGTFTLDVSKDGKSITVTNPNTGEEKTFSGQALADIESNMTPPSGATAIEYAIIAALIVVGVVKTVQTAVGDITNH